MSGDGPAPTERQQDALDALVRLTAEKGYPPSVRELGEAIGVSSPSTNHMLLKHLVDKGCIQWERGKSRTIRVVPS